METRGKAPTLRSTEIRRRIILFPLPFQGHINPMLQLANILHTQGFKITIIHTEYNSPNPSNYPHFTFKSISDRISEMTTADTDTSVFIKYLNDSCEDPFRNCVGELLDEEAVACLIIDAGFYFTQAVADELKIPRLVLQTNSLACVATSDALFTSSHLKNYFNLPKEDYETPVAECPLMNIKDIVRITSNPQGMADFVTNMHNQMKASSGLIWNTFKELEESTLEIINQDFAIPIFTLGPFHKYFSASSSSLIQQDRTILSWLDTKAPKSVIYASFGSVARITKSEFQEVAHGLANTGLPFLWVVQPGIVHGLEWFELLSEKFLEGVHDKGRIVQWCPQQEVLSHLAIGCFLTHCGWNSTLESICEGVPMVCLPCFVDQPINARYVCDVWKIGVLLEDGFERVGIEMTIKRVMVGEKGKEIRKRICYLKDQVNLSVEEGGSSHRSLKSLVSLIKSFVRS